MLCYCGCGNEVYDIQVDPRDGKIMPCEVCLRVSKECYLGLLSVEERAELGLPDIEIETSEFEDTPAMP